VEPVSSSACEQWHGALAMDALGALEPDERAGLLAHLDGCASCQELARELAQTASVLAFVDHDELSTSSLPPALTERVLGALHDDALAARRRRRMRAGAAFAAVGAIAAALALLVALGSTTAPGTARGTHTEVLSGQRTSATATAVLSATSWGTAGTLTERGLPAGGVYVVAMRTDSTSWWAAASYRGVAGRTVRIPMSCFVPLSKITGIRVTNAAGTTVLESVAAPGSSW
jgi:Putative zinc-finger